ncbi:MAG: RidA family protein [Verrucomicrobiales bacterium]|nr:RidA family protein [Verrucomicrobiales bacterium]
MSAEAKIKELGLELPPAPPKGGVYKPLVTVNNLAYLSGHGPFQSDGTYITGRLGEDLTLEQGQAAARQVGLALLATIKEELGSLDRVKRVIKTLALVNSTADFVEQPQTINGFSELFGEVFGQDNGIGARSALGTNVLPGNIAVEIEVILEIE